MQIIYGVNPVKERLKTPDAGLRSVIIARGRTEEGIRELIGLAAAAGIGVEYRERTDLDRLTGHRHHQGVVCLCVDHAYASLESLLSACRAVPGGGLLLILDGITDPQNLGSLIRTAYGLGVQGVVIPQDRSAGVTPAVIKASAGAALHLPVARVVNLAKAIDALKEEGFWVYGAEAGGEMSADSPDFKGSVALVMGSEGRGIRPLIRKKCDFFVSIPLEREMDSLNVSVAAGIILYGIARKRKG